MVADLTKLMPEHPGFHPDKGVTLVLNENTQFDIDIPQVQGNRHTRRANRLPSTPERETDFKLASIVCFGEGQSFPYLPVVSNLISLTDEAERAVIVIADSTII